MRQSDSSVKTIKSVTKIAKFVFLGLVILAIILLLIQNNVSFAVAPKFGGVPDNSLIDWVNNLMVLVSSTIGVLAVVMIIIAGIVYMFDLGGGKQVGLAKDIIITTISGLLLFIIASWLLGEINSIFPALY